MKPSYTFICVPDVATSLDFFERAFGLQRRFLHESGTYGELETGATTLASAVPAQALAPPKTKPWGQVVSYLRAPGGCLVELCLPMHG